MALINRSTMYISFLRPLALPRASTIHRFFSSTPSTSTSTSISISTSSTSTSSSPSHQTPPATLPVETISATTISEEKPSQQVLSYHVYRTPSNHCPVYPQKKRGGNLHQTKVQKIEGDIERLRMDLRDELKLEDKDVAINQLTKQIIIRGFHKEAVVAFLQARGF